MCRAQAAVCVGPRGGGKAWPGGAARPEARLQHVPHQPAQGVQEGRQAGQEAEGTPVAEAGTGTGGRCCRGAPGHSLLPFTSTARVITHRSYSCPLGGGGGGALDLAWNFFPAWSCSLCLPRFTGRSSVHSFWKVWQSLAPVLGPSPLASAHFSWESYLSLKFSQKRRGRRMGTCWHGDKSRAATRRHQVPKSGAWLLWRWRIPPSPPQRWQKLSRQKLLSP